MFFRQIYHEGLAQGGYLVGCQASGAAAAVDPKRDIGVYLEEAERNNLRVVAVAETHIHADFLSGARELARATGATLYLSDEGGGDWKYAGLEGFAHRLVKHGDEIELGNVRLRVLHTPGHTPEHVSFLVTDGSTADQPGFALTGDFVFVGDVGRPDLLDEAAGFVDAGLAGANPGLAGAETRFEGARRLFESLRDKFLTLPDYVQVWPGHGAGSACGKALGAVASSTVGYERRFSWWAGYVAGGDLEGFTAELLSGQPDAPAYFARMKRDNKLGPAILGERGAVRKLGGGEARQILGRGGLLVDTRPRADYQRAAVPGSLHLPAGKAFSLWAAWLIDADQGRDLVLLAPDAGEAARLRAELSLTGIDRVAGFVDGLEGFETASQSPLPAERFGGIPGLFVLDVRTRNEYQQGHIPGAVQIHAGRLYRALGQIPRDRAVGVTCQSGARSAAAASYLRSQGYADVVELEGGYEAWDKARQAKG